MQQLEKNWVDQIVAAGIAKVGEIQGCDNDDIAHLEKHFQINLPDAYKNFLRTMGKNVGLFLNDCTITYPDIMEFREQADELAKAGGVSLPETAFVFLIHDYQFHYFDTANGAFDPATFRYVEDETSSIKTFDSFTQCMSNFVKTEVAAWNENRI